MSSDIIIKTSTEVIETKVYIDDTSFIVKTCEQGPQGPAGAIGPPGPLEISSDINNFVELGSDGKIWADKDYIEEIELYALVGL